PAGPAVALDADGLPVLHPGGDGDADGLAVHGERLLFGACGGAQVHAQLGVVVVPAEARAAAALAEHGAEDVLEVLFRPGALPAEGIAALASGKAAACRGLFALRRLDLVGVLPLVAVPVVLPAAFGVAQHLVGLVDLLELALGLLVVGVEVGMVLARQPTVGLLDLVARGLAVHAQQ